MPRKFSIISYFFCTFFLLVVISCNSVYTSKKTGYFKIDFPERNYITFNDPSYPYSFEYPSYAHIAKDSTFFDTQSKNPYWINIVFPDFNGKIFLSYKIIGGNSVYEIKDAHGNYRDSIGKNNFEQLVDDSYNLTYKNEIKANSIEDSVMHTPNNLTGIFFKVSGNVATYQQFFLSDTLHHFLRGALYFNATPNEDSLRPVTNFLRQDLNHIINTLQWK